MTLRGIQLYERPNIRRQPVQQVAAFHTDNGTSAYLWPCLHCTDVRYQEFPSVTALFSKVSQKPLTIASSSVRQWRKGWARWGHGKLGISPANFLRMITTCCLSITSSQGERIIGRQGRPTVRTGESATGSLAGQIPCGNRVLFSRRK